MYQNLVLCNGVGIKRDGTNGCLTRKDDGVLVWTDHTLTKLGGSLQDDTAGKQIRFVLQMIQFIYTLMMGTDDIKDGVPFQKYLGPLSI